MGWASPVSESVDLEGNEYTVEESKSLADRLGIDNITFLLRAPVYAEKHSGQDGILFYGAGLIHSMDDLQRVQLPNPLDDRMYDEAAEFAANKGQFSAWFNTRIGIFSAMLSLGLEGFSLALYDDLPLVERLLDMYRTRDGGRCGTSLPAGI